MAKHSGFTATGVIDLGGFPLINVGGVVGLQQEFTEKHTIEAPSRDTVMSLGGGIYALGAGGSISSGSPLTVDPGRSHIALVVNTAPDYIGSLTFTGTIVDPNTGIAASGSEDITISAATLTTDASTTDAGGNTVYNLQSVVVTESVFAGSVDISTSDMNITDVDAYAIMWTKRRNLATTVYGLDSVEFLGWPNATSARMYLHTYTVTRVGGGRIFNIASVVDFQQSSAPTAARPYYFRAEPTGTVSLQSNVDGVFTQLQLDPTTPAWDDIEVALTFTKPLTV